MAKANQIIHNFYGLQMEINLLKPDEDVLAELNEKPDPTINKHLSKIKQLTAKAKAKANQVRFQNAIHELALLKQKGIEELKKLFLPQERVALVPLFRKFEELGDQDQQSITEDEELLQFLELLKNRIDASGNK
ncbi:hypothetical protein [Flavisolibacter tropicus]|uniref:Uncharacterized protein n=1 Tax=Flavisolibacter tropicus TaxID=1492898 RepID=A0A172U1S6_9BACT|nr:hypothetical protein [Flavisolibacter tropicus]ANE53138.1 hypothetical protein SY85_24360 [Flavisolibacter tropicus]